MGVIVILSLSLAQVPKTQCYNIPTITAHYDVWHVCTGLIRTRVESYSVTFKATKDQTVVHVDHFETHSPKFWSKWSSFLPTARFSRSHVLSNHHTASGPDDLYGLGVGKVWWGGDLVPFINIDQHHNHHPTPNPIHHNHHSHLYHYQYTIITSLCIGVLRRGGIKSLYGVILSHFCTGQDKMTTLGKKLAQNGPKNSTSASFSLLPQFDPKQAPYFAMPELTTILPSYWFRQRLGMVVRIGLAANWEQGESTRPAPPHPQKYLPPKIPWNHFQHRYSLPHRIVQHTNIQDPVGPGYNDWVYREICLDSASPTTTKPPFFCPRVANNPLALSI